MDQKAAEQFTSEFLARITTSARKTVAQQIIAQRDNPDYKALELLATKMGKWETNGVLAVSERSFAPGDVIKLTESLPEHMPKRLHLIRMHNLSQTAVKLVINLQKFEAVAEQVGYKGMLKGVESNRPWFPR